MKVVHFDCLSGASGDMLLGALLDAGVAEATVRDALNSLELPIRLVTERVKRCGIAATFARIEAPHEHAHRHLHHIEAIIDKGKLTDSQRHLAKSFFRRLAEAEAEVHGIPIQKVHFHEVGALDSIADFVGVAVALDSLKADRFSCRSIPTGSGTIQCEHGVMPVPAPATANLLRGVPIAASNIQTELTTPTGAAILSTIVRDWTESPSMTIEKIGYGAGSKDFSTQPNVLRIMVGSAVETGSSDQVWLLETNLDDVTPEVIGYTFDRLMAAGALDVWTTTVQMKKQRPGVIVSLLATESNFQALESILFSETGTLGIRRSRFFRSKSPRPELTVDSPWGQVRTKAGKPEYDDCVRIARESGLPLREIQTTIIRKQKSMGT